MKQLQKNVSGDLLCSLKKPHSRPPLTSARSQARPWIGLLGCSFSGLLTQPSIPSHSLTCFVSPKGTCQGRKWKKKYIFYELFGGEVGFIFHGLYFDTTYMYSPQVNPLRAVLPLQRFFKYSDLKYWVVCEQALVGIGQKERPASPLSCTNDRFPPPTRPPIP